MDCPICLTVMTDATTFQCNHTFCFLCIKEWLTSHQTCPLCRSECSLSGVVDIFKVRGEYIFFFNCEKYIILDDGTVQISLQEYIQQVLE